VNIALGLELYHRICIITYKHNDGIKFHEHNNIVNSLLVAVVVVRGLATSSLEPKQLVLERLGMEPRRAEKEQDIWLSQRMEPRPE